MTQLSQKEKREALNEVSVLRQLSHPHIIKYRKSFEEKGMLCIVMDYASKGDLYQKIKKRHGKLFQEDQIMKWFIQIALALEYTHSNHILHRDLKTQNIFLDKNNDVLLGDFGIARVLQSTMECARTMVGTPYYLSPELCREEPYNNKSDVWSLGCILYELATHRHAFEANSMKGLIGKILRGIYPPISSRYSKDLKNLIDICLQKDVRKRPSVFELLEMKYIKQYVDRYGPQKHSEQPAKRKPNSRPSSNASNRAPPPDKKKYADPPKFSQYHENKASEIKARILQKYRKEEERQAQDVIDEKRAKIERKRKQMQFMEEKRKQMEADREAARRRAVEERARAEREQWQQEQNRARMMQMKREQERRLQEREQHAERERRRIWQENRAAAQRNKKRLYDHVYGDADVQQPVQQNWDEEPRPRSSQPQYQKPSPTAEDQEKKKKQDEQMAEFRKKQFWEAKIQAAKNRQRVLDQLYGNEPALQKDEDKGSAVSRQVQPEDVAQDSRLNDIQQRRKNLEEEIAQKEKDFIRHQREFDQPSSSSDSDNDSDVRSIISRDGPVRPDKFVMGGKTVKFESSPSSRESLCYRIESLRLHLEQQLGLESFIQAYELLQNQQEDDDDDEFNDRLLSILGKARLDYVSLIHQLIVCESDFNESQ